MYNLKSMKVILLQDNKKLGKKGDIVNVSDGFAFNNLIPQGIAQVVTGATMAEVERMQKKQEKESKMLKSQLQKDAEKIDKKKITLTAQAKGTKLFGSIAQKDIVQAIKDQYSVDVDEKMIQLDSAIKELTTREVVIDYGDGVTASVIITIVAK